MLSSQTIKIEIANITIGALPLTSGKIIDDVTLRYELVGPEGAPVILACHALTGNHNTVGTENNPGWWSGLIGPKKYIDTERYQVLTFNVLGGNDGSTGPASNNPQTKERYQGNFPTITVQDIVRSQYKALQKLNITKLEAIIGGSLGGMQVLEWGLLYPKMMKKLIVLAATPVFSDYGIAFNHIGESAIKNDPEWNNGQYQPDKPLKGLELARMVGMVTYRTADLFTERFNRQKKNSAYTITSYLDYQGKKLAHRFDPNSYLCLLEAMNHHDIGHERGNWQAAAAKYECPLLAISYGNDLIYKPEAIEQFTNYVTNSLYHHVETAFGHDGFLTEYEKWGNVIKQFLTDEEQKRRRPDSDVWTGLNRRR